MMESGDVYFRNNVPIGIVIQETIEEEQFANYRTVQFLAKTGGLEYRNIYRITEGPEVFLGCVSELRCSLNELQQVNCIPPYDQEIVELAKTAVLQYPQRDVDWLEDALIELSEKELEEHFNQVFV